MSFVIRNNVNIKLNLDDKPVVDERCISFTKEWNSLVLKAIARLSTAPTKASRILFLWSTMCQLSTQNKCLDSMISPTFYKRLDSNDSWSDLCCAIATKKILLKIGSFVESEYELVLDSHSTVLNTRSFMDSKEGVDFSNYLDSYLSIRDNDNNANAGVISSSVPQPNSGYFDIALNNSVTDVKKWTPMKFNGVTQSYATPEWGSVTGVLSTEKFNELITTTQNLYPSDTQLNNEITEVINVKQNLTDKQKMIAEFWAGGPGTVTPPGLWNIITGCMLDKKSSFISDQINTYHYVNTALFQAGIMAWKLKRANMQARPVQRIRLNQSSVWLPYQPSNFITPPFPDFVSGHSTFSSAASGVLKQLFQTDFLDDLRIDKSMLYLISPLFYTKSVDSYFHNIFIFPNTSSIDSAPNSGCFLGWNSLTEMAQEAGMSRIYGGIHVMSSNYAGLLLGDSIAMSLLS
jgi:hypothetical protein